MQKSDSIAALAAALAKAQGEMENAGKNSLSQPGCFYERRDNAAPVAQEVAA